MPWHSCKVTVKNVDLSSMQSQRRYLDVHFVEMPGMWMIRKNVFENDVLYRNYYSILWIVAFSAIILVLGIIEHHSKITNPLEWIWIYDLQPQLGYPVLSSILRHPAKFMYVWWRENNTCCSKYRPDSRFVPSQWEMALLCNDISHWLGANLESSLKYVEFQGCHIDGLVQERCDSSALAMELCLSYTSLSIWASWHLKSPATQLFVQQLFQTKNQK